MEITKQNLLDRISDYTSGTIPPQVSFTTAAIDVQSQWIYWLVLGHDANGGIYWIDWGAEHIIPIEALNYRSITEKTPPTTEQKVAAMNRTASKVSQYKPLLVVDDEILHSRIQEQSKSSLVAKIVSGKVSFPSDLNEQGRDYLILHLTKGEKDQGRSDLFDCSAAAYAASLSLTTGE